MEDDTSAEYQGKLGSSPYAVFEDFEIFFLIRKLQVKKWTDTNGVI